VATSHFSDLKDAKTSRSPSELASQTIKMALDDAGLAIGEVDGLITMSVSARGARIAGGIEGAEADA
jgi:hypothetical protein